jgi:hypothetical protein
MHEHPRSTSCLPCLLTARLLMLRSDLWFHWMPLPRLHFGVLAAVSQLLYDRECATVLVCVVVYI